MTKLTISVKCPHCLSTKVKKNGKKPKGEQNFYCHSCKKQFLYEYKYRGACPSNKKLLRFMTLNGSGIRDIMRVLGLSPVCIIMVLRKWFSSISEPNFTGSYKEVQLDEFWSFVKHRRQGKRWVWYAFDKETGTILAFQIGKRNDATCRKLLRKLQHLNIEKYCTDDWKSYKTYIPKEKHIISKKKTTHIERMNKDFRTHLKRLCRETACFSKADDMHYGIIKTYIHYRNAA